MSLEISLSGSLGFTSATGITDSLATPAATNDSPAQLSIIIPADWSIGRGGLQPPIDHQGLYI